MRRGLLIVAAVIAASGCSETPMSPTRVDPVAAEGGAAASEARIDTAVGHGGVPLETTLTGAAEVPGPGDPDASGSARITLNPGQGEVCFVLEVSNIAPATASHIHIGGPTTAGPILITLAPPPTSGSSSACVSASRDLIREIIQNPEGYYVNVHNADFPAGAARGQLSR